MLTIDKLTHVYPNGVKALDAVSLTVPRGMYEIGRASCRERV